MVKPASAFGRSGLHDWFVQRLSAVVLLAYVLFLAGFFFGSNEVDHATWRTLFSGTGFKLFSLLVVVALVAHAWIGMWTVFTDYIKPVAIRLVAQSMLILTCVSLLLWGISILWSV